MRHIIVLFIISLLIMPALANAQNQSTRFEKQHHIKYVESHLKQIEDNLLKSFESTNLGVVASSVQTLRELEQIFPEDGFNSFIDPLAKIVQDEKAETQTRLLSVLALDGLHSDKGDESIYYAAKYTNNNSVKDLCNCLSIESMKINLADKTHQ